MYGPLSNVSSARARRGRRGQHYSDDSYESSGETDLSYEQLLQLDERNVVVGMSDAQINRLTLQQVVTADFMKNYTSCPICLEEYTEGEIVRRLPCFCPFHLECIDTHLASSKLCPTCRINIAESEEPHE
jgi:E3 ubiquitin-protein ligase RLIM